MSNLVRQHYLDLSEEVALVHAAKQGDTAAFEQLVERNTKKIFRVAMHILGSREDAEEAVQDAFVKAFQRLREFEERARFSTWLTRIAVNEALGRLRAVRRAATVSMDDEPEESHPLRESLADWRPNPEEHYGIVELRDILKKALASLSDACRVIFLLRDVEGLSIAETAEMLNVSIPTVKARLFRARLRLRERLSKYFELGRTGISPLVSSDRLTNDLNQQR